MPHIKTKHANIYYESYGKGQPLVCIGGYTNDHTVWAPLIDHLSGQYEVIVFDSRGAGQTQDNGEPLSAEIMAQDTIHLIEALQLNKPHIMGLSLGGSIAQTVAAKYPEQIDKLVLLATSAKWRKAIRLAFASLLTLCEKNLEFDLIAELILSWVLGENFLQQPQNISAAKKAMLDNPYPQSIIDQRRQYDALNNFNGIDDLKKISSKTLIGYGKEDIISLPMESKLIADHIKNTELIEFNSAHYIVLEDTESLARELLRFLGS